MKFIFSPTWEAHLRHVEKILHLLFTHQFYAKISKCRFGVRSVDYLGHIIDGQGVQADPSKLHAIWDWSPSYPLTTLRAFLGHTDFYLCFVKDYASISSPLTDLLKSSTWTWTTEAAQAFQNLKTAMLILLVLTLPDFSIPFEVTTDASGMAVGVVLSENSHPYCLFSTRSSTFAWQ